MPKAKLSDLFVKRAPVPKSGRVEYFDRAMPAFGFRVTSAGHRSWFYFYRANGRQRRLTLGAYPKVSLKDARAMARAAATQVAEGHDPATERQAERAAAVGSFAEVAAQFIELYAKRRQNTWRETERYLKQDVLPHWRGREIRDIKRGDVLRLLDKTMAEGKATKAKHLHGHLRKLFTWSVERGFLDSSPMANLPSPSQTVERDRVLTDSEIAAIWIACNDLGFPFGPLIRLLFLTAQRRNEVAAMRWSDLDLEAGLWRLPREATKMKRAHEVPLSTDAIALLEDLPKFGKFALASGRTGDRPVSGWSRMKRRLDASSGATGWRLHDIRRTAASGMARLNAPPHVLSKILGHVSDGQGVTGIYNRYAYDDEKRRAVEAWAQYIGRLIDPSGSNVVELREQGHAGQA
jgi:integrase